MVWLVQPPERMVPRTIENTREPDETVCRPDDDEVISLELYIVIAINVIVILDACSCWNWFSR